MSDEEEVKDKKDQQKKKRERRCVNCEGNHMATKKNCSKRRHQIITREKDYVDARGGMLKKKKTTKRKTEAEINRGTEGTGKKNIENSDHMNVHKEKEDKNAMKTNSSNKKTTYAEKDANWSMSLENLLNGQELERWDKMEVKEIEYMGRQMPNNI